MWVFAYGSLMWNPGFEYVEQKRGRLEGYHRELCIYSWIHRGTKDQPGLVLGLDPGGYCDGMVFRVPDEHKDAVRAYLDARELPTGVYEPEFGKVDIQDDAGKLTGDSVTALAYIVVVGHEQYTGRISEDERAHLVRTGIGPSGTSLDYLSNSMRELDAMQIEEPAMGALLARVRREME